MTQSLWRFQAVDSWFFKESRPMESIGNSELNSVFPPPARTVAGAIRAAIAKFNNVDWSKYSNDLELAAQLGNSDNFGSLHIKALYLSLQDEEGNWHRLYPVPLNVVALKDQKLNSRHRLRVGKPIACDLGESVCMPTVDKEIRAEKTIYLTDYWLKAASFFKVLQGDIPKTEEFIRTDDLLQIEPRLGIAINQQRRTVEPQKLYQTRHIRPRTNLAISVEIDGLTPEIQPKQGVIRLGAEGRGSTFNVIHQQKLALLPKPNLFENDYLQGLMLVLLSPLQQDYTEKYSPLPGFKQNTHQGITVWKGLINGIALTLYSAVLGRTQREGGWDLIKQQPRPVQSFIPAGSVFYCTVDNGDIATALSKLHLYQLDANPDSDKALGRGLLAAGLWHRHESLIRNSQ